MANLFDFKFAPIQNPLKIGYYHWFWLTDGFYWINIGNQKLFELSDETINYWQINIDSDEQKCMDYPVVRLWEDMLEILPTILNPVPKSIHQLFLQFQENCDKNSNKWYDYVENEESSGRYKENELLFGVPLFFDAHIISTMHIASSPLLYFWRYQESGGDKMWIGWDFTQTITDDDTNQEMPIWSANKGVAKMDFNDFMNEVKQFNDKFLNQMQEKIDEILSSNELKSLYPDDFDFSVLQNEQNSREKELNKALNLIQEIDWDTRLFHYQKAGIIV